MTINVRTPTNADGEDDAWAATHWRVEDGSLWVVDTDRVIAEYPPGQWAAVWRVEEAKEDGVNRSSGEALRDSHFTFHHPHGIWLAGELYGITTIDFHHGDGTATLHAKANR